MSCTKTPRSLAPSTVARVIGTFPNCSGAGLTGNQFKARELRLYDGSGSYSTQIKEYWIVTDCQKSGQGSDTWSLDDHMVLVRAYFADEFENQKKTWLPGAIRRSLNRVGASELSVNDRVTGVRYSNVTTTEYAGLGTIMSGTIDYDRFSCGVGEEPPPWGQPPYGVPGAPGSCEYASSLECAEPNEHYLALMVDALGNPIIEDCDVTPWDYCHAPCDTEFGPPTKSIQIPTRMIDMSSRDLQDAVWDLLAAHYPALEAEFLALGCPWPPPSGGGGGGLLDSPVTLHFNENLTGVFADPSIDMTFFSVVDLPVGGRYEIGDQLGRDNWYSFAIRDKSVASGLSSYTGETLLAMLSRIRPKESLVLVAGEDGVPAQLDLRECLRRFLVFYGVPFVDDLPQFFLRAGDEIVAPEVDAFVIQPNQEAPESLYEWLERFFGPFRGYTFRADTTDRLVVTQPAWVDLIGLRLTVYRRRQPLDRVPVRNMARAPWSTTRPPLVEWEGTVNGTPVSGSHSAPLAEEAAAEVVTIGGVDVRLSWTGGRVVASVWPPAGVDTTTGDLYSITFVFRPQGATTEVLELTDLDLALGEVLTTSADSVINQAIVPVRRREFTPGQQIMQAAALALKSPVQLMAGLFGNNPEFGPMAEILDSPAGFMELVNDAVQAGTWFWPADDTVVAQPGGNVTVAFEVEEWAEQWRVPSAPHQAAAAVNTWSDTVDLPTSGAEVKLFDFQFPRQTTNFAPSPYGAQGSVYGRWRGGEQPGIQVRVGNARFVEFGYFVDVAPIFGTTLYYLWGAVVKLNGTGTAFSEGVLETYRFGYAHGEDGRWEGDPPANVPALAESQMLYPNRSFTAPELPYTVSPETALAIARGIVEENLTPKVVYRLPVAPSKASGWAARPHHLGRASRVLGAGLNISGRVTAVEYEEAHTAQGSTSGVTVEVEANEAPPGSRAASKHFARAAYGISHYQQEE